MSRRLDAQRGADRAVLLELLRQRRRMRDTLDKLSDARLAELFGICPADVHLLELQSRQG